MKYLFFKFLFFSSFFLLLFLVSCVSFTSYDSLERLPYSDVEGYEYQNTAYQPTNDTTRFMVFTNKKDFEEAFGTLKESVDFSEKVIVAIAKYQKNPVQIQTEHITYTQKEIIWLYETSNSTASSNTNPSVRVTLVDEENFDKVVFVENGKTVYIISNLKEKEKM